MTAYLSLIFAIAGLVVYAISNNPKVMELARLTYWSGLLAFLLTVGERSASLFEMKFDPVPSIAVVKNALHVANTNRPINEVEQNYRQAALERSNAKSFEGAIKMLEKQEKLARISSNAARKPVANRKTIEAALNR